MINGKNKPSITFIQTLELILFKLTSYDFLLQNLMGSHKKSQMISISKVSSKSQTNEIDGLFLLLLTCHGQRGHLRHAE